MSDMALDYEIHRITVDEFFQMGEAGIFDDRHVELLDGTLVDLSPIGPPHAIMASRILAYLAGLLGNRAEAVISGTLPLGNYDAPQPDIAIYRPLVLKPMPKRFRLDDARVLIEVSDTSLRKDLRPKLKLYARFGVPEYLVVDLNGRLIYHFTDPNEFGYQNEQRLAGGDHFSLVDFSDLILDVDRFLPPP